MELLTTYEFTRPMIEGETHTEEVTLHGRYELLGELRMGVAYHCGPDVYMAPVPLFTIREYGETEHVAEYAELTYPMVVTAFEDLAPAAATFVATH